MTTSDAVTNVMLDSIESTIGPSPILEICNATNTVLVQLQLPADWLEDSTDGVKEQKGEWSDPTAAESGIPAKAIFRNAAGDPMWEVTASGPDGTGAIRMNDSMIEAGNEVKLTGVTVISTAHPSTSDYIRRVHNIGGSLRGGSQTIAQRASALDRFFATLDREGLMPLIREAYLLTGVSYDGLPAKLIYEEGAGTTLTLENFVSGQYQQSGLLCGLKGDGETMAISTHLPGTLNVPLSLSAFVTDEVVLSGRQVFVSDGYQGFVHELRRRGGLLEFVANNSSGNIAGVSREIGPRFLAGVARLETGNRSRFLYENGVLIADSLADVPYGQVAVQEYRLFASYRVSNDTWGDYSQARMTFAHIGDELSDAQAAALNTITQQLMVDLGVITTPLTND